MANLGLAYLAKDAAQTAAPLLLQAELLQPSDDSASAFGALGHLVAGERERAYEKAENLCRANPYLPIAQAVRVTSAPTELPYDSLKESVPESVRKNPDVARALHVRAAREGNLEEAESVLRLVENIDQVPLLAYNLGTVILDRAMNAARMTGMGPIATDRERVEEARALLTTAIPKLEESVADYAPALYNRAQAHLLLGDWQSAYSDFSIAYEAAPQETDLARAYASAALARGESRIGIKILERTLKLDAKPRTRLLLALALEQEGKKDSLARQEQLLTEGLSDVDSLDRNLRLQYVLQVVNVLSSLKSLDTQRVEVLVAHIHDPFEAAVVRASAMLKIGDRDLANASIDTALTYLGDIEEWSWRREVAVLLEELERLDEALKLWLELYTPGIDSPETRRVLRCARDSQRDNTVLEVCERLRANGVYVSNLITLEADTLVEYSEYKAARDILLDALERNPEDFQARTRLLNVAVVLNWVDIVREYSSGLPDASEVSKAEFGYQIVGALGILGQAEKAARYAYDLTRRFPDNSLSHRALIISIFGPRAGRLELSRPTKVELDCAVKYLDKAAGESSWIVIEGGLNAELSRGEFSPDHPLSVSMMDKEVGEEFLLPGSSLRQRPGVIEAIENKIVFRANESIRLWPERFPDTWMLERFTAREDEEFTSLLQELVGFQKQLWEGRREAEELYETKRIPLAGLATIAGKAIPEVVEYLAHKRNAHIYCTMGSRGQLAAAAEAIDKAPAVAVDPVALTTLSLLGEEFSFDSLPFRCVVTEGTLDEFRSLLREDLDDPRKQGYLGFDGERLVLTELNRDVERKVQAARRIFVELVEAQCEIVGGRALASLEPDQRATLRRVLGTGTSEALALSQLRRIPLWTDDFATGFLAGNEYGIQQIWTQAVYLRLQALERISLERFDSMTIRLCQWSYEFTAIRPSTVIAASNRCDWDPDQEPLRSVLRQFEGEWGQAETISFALESITEIWRQAPLEASATRVTLRVCDFLLRKPKGRRVLTAVRKQINKAFGINVLRAQSAKLVIDSRLASPGPSGLFLA